MDSASYSLETQNVFLLKLYFIYKAIQDGWNVTRINSNKYAFTKKTRYCNISTHSFIRKYLPTKMIAK
jgi:hypothetical protein